MENSRTKPAPSRVDRRKIRTRQALLRAAYEIIAARGWGALRMADVAEKADVATGSVYNYFADKPALLEAVKAEFVDRFGETIDATTARFDDPAERLSAAHRLNLERAAADPVWARFLLQFVTIHGMSERGLAARFERDIVAGCRTGRFRFDDETWILPVLGGVAFGLITAVAEGRLTGADVPRASAHLLRVLGLSEREAEEISSRPLPTLTPPAGASRA